MELGGGLGGFVCKVRCIVHIMLGTHTALIGGQLRSGPLHNGAYICIARQPAVCSLQISMHLLHIFDAKSHSGSPDETPIPYSMLLRTPYAISNEFTDWRLADRVHADSQFHKENEVRGEQKVKFAYEGIRGLRSKRPNRVARFGEKKIALEGN